MEQMAYQWNRGEDWRKKECEILVTQQYDVQELSMDR